MSPSMPRSFKDSRHRLPATPCQTRSLGATKERVSIVSGSALRRGNLWLPWPFCILAVFTSLPVSAGNYMASCFGGPYLVLAESTGTNELAMPKAVTGLVHITRIRRPPPPVTMLQLSEVAWNATLRAIQQDGPLARDSKK